jgi:hypothetical protein
VPNYWANLLLLLLVVAGKQPWGLEELPAL